MANTSAHSVTVPGAVDAWAAILKAHGRFGLDRALAPAIRYAGEGFPVAARIAWAAADNAVQIHGANGYSDEYPVGRFYRNCKAAVIYEGTREIHKLMQADYALGNRQDKPRRIELPAYKRS